MTTIGLSANDQLLAVTLNPKVASGQQNTVDIRVEFSDDWDEFAKSAVFFTSNNTNTVYEKVLTNGECIVPAEVMSKDGILYIGVRGVNSQNNEVKTTSLVKYKITEGTPSGTGTEVEPTPNVYQQLLSAYGKTDNSINKEISDRKTAIATEKAERQTEIAVERNRITNLATLPEGSTTGDAELIDARVGYNGIVHQSLGDAIRSQATNISPNRLNLSVTGWDILKEEVATTFTGSGYYYRVHKKDHVPEQVTSSTIGMITFPCSQGEEYLIYFGQNLSTTVYNAYFVPLKDDGTCSINETDIGSYMEVYDAENFIYKVTIPENTTQLYSASITADLRVEKVSASGGTRSIEWLRLNETNFPDNCIPPSALPNIADETIKYEYGNCIAKPLNFGNSLVAFGDSITAGVTSPNLEVTTDKYIKLFADSRNLSLTNHAVSGSTITDSESAYSTYKRVTTLTYSGDTIVIAGGVNDYTTQKTIGDYNSTDVTTFYGALRGICSHLKTNHPNATVIFITPVNTTLKPNTTETTPLNAYRNAIFEIATEYGFNVVDGTQINLPSKAGAYHDYMMTDGVHPTVEGHKLYARSLMGILG